MKKIDYYEICKLKLKYLNYSDKTINNYLGYIRKFLNNIDNEPSRLNSNDFQSYLDKYDFTSIHESQISCDTKKRDIDAKFTTFGNRAACRVLLEVINVLDNDMKLKVIEMMKNRKIIS